MGNIKPLTGFIHSLPPLPLPMFCNRFTNSVRGEKKKSSLIRIASKFSSAFQLLSVSEAFSEMQLVSFTACLLGILTLLSYCSFTLTCRSQGSELDSVWRRLELWHCPSWLSESGKGAGGKKERKAIFLSWGSQLSKVNAQTEGNGREGGKACSS